MPFIYASFTRHRQVNDQEYRIVIKIEQLYNLDRLTLYLSNIHLKQASKYHRFPVSIISHAVGAIMD